MASNPKVTPDLVAWQRRHYGEGHRSRLNLTLHILTAPIFVLGTLGLLAGLWAGEWARAGAGLGLVVAVIAVQGFGHSKEAKKPDPFLSPLDLLARIFTENLFNFWRFVFSGDFFKAWRQAA